MLKKRWGFPSGSDGKESVCQAGDPGLIPGSVKIPWRRKWQPARVFLPGEFHGQSSLVGYSPWVTESDTSEWLTHTHTHTHTHRKILYLFTKTQISALTALFHLPYLKCTSQKINWIKLIIYSVLSKDESFHLSHK